TNFCGLKAMTAALGSAAAARAVFDDLHFANDAEAPTTYHNPAPYRTDLGPGNPTANPDIDCSSLQPIDPGGPPLQQLLDAISGAAPPLPVPSAMSNALLVSAAHTKTGRPIAVFGPQTGYFMPQLLVEKDVHGPDIDARGVAFAGTDLIVQLGRGRNYAFSATSAGGDNLDQWVLKLCEPRGGQRRRPAHRRPRRRARVPRAAQPRLRAAGRARQAHGRHADRDRLAALHLHARARLGARLLPRQQPELHDRRLQLLPPGDG